MRFLCADFMSGPVVDVNSYYGRTVNATNKAEFIYDLKESIMIPHTGEGRCQLQLQEAQFLGSPHNLLTAGNLVLTYKNDSGSVVTIEVPLAAGYWGVAEINDAIATKLGAIGFKFLSPWCEIRINPQSHKVEFVFSLLSTNESPMKIGTPSVTKLTVTGSNFAVQTLLGLGSTALEVTSFQSGNIGSLVVDAKVLATPNAHQLQVPMYCVHVNLVSDTYGVQGRMTDLLAKIYRPDTLLGSDVFTYSPENAQICEVRDIIGKPISSIKVSLRDLQGSLLHMEQDFSFRLQFKYM